MEACTPIATPPTPNDMGTVSVSHPTHLAQSLRSYYLIRSPQRHRIAHPIQHQSSISIAPLCAGTFVSVRSSSSASPSIPNSHQFSPILNQFSPILTSSHLFPPCLISPTSAHQRPSSSPIFSNRPSNRQHFSRHAQHDILVTPLLTSHLPPYPRHVVSPTPFSRAMHLR